MISESGHSPHLALNTRKVIFKALHDDSLSSTPYLFLLIVHCNYNRTTENISHSVWVISLLLFLLCFYM